MHVLRVYRFVIYPFLVIWIGTLFSSGCRKGPEDPFLSLRSRKARLTGDWNVVSGYGFEKTIVSGWHDFFDLGLNDSTAVSMVFDGEWIAFDTSGNFVAPERSQLSIRCTFRKNGIFRKTVTTQDTTENVFDSHFTLTYAEQLTVGRWNFLQGNGDVKNKQHLLLQNDTITTYYRISRFPLHGPPVPAVDSTVVITSDSTQGEIYELYRLANKEIIYQTTRNSSLTTTEEEWDPDQKKYVKVDITRSHFKERTFTMLKE